MGGHSGRTMQGTKCRLSLEYGILGSNPTKSTDVFIFSVYVFSVLGSSLATGWSPIQAVLPTVYKISNFRVDYEWEQVRGGVVGWGTMLQAGRSRDLVPIRWLFQFTSSFQPHYGPGVDSASKRNEYQESSSGVMGRRHVSLTTLPPSGSWFSRQNMGASTSDNPMGLHGMLQG
jgi:hypothetical protein